MRLAGKVIRFDKVRGYGFITPDGGGDDVFLHANDLDRGGQGVSFGNESDEYIDVLSAAEFEHAVTELLLTVTPPLSAPQIVSVRAAFTQMAHQQLAGRLANVLPTFRAG